VKARNKYGSKAFGWHGGVIEEKSPFTLKDLVKQRRRWFYGLLQNLKYFSLKDKISQSIRALLWSLGFLSGLASILTWIYPQTLPNYYLRIVFSITSLLWLFSYQIGAFMNGTYLPFSKRLAFHFLALVFAFPNGLIESAMPVVSLICRPKTFEVVKK
jgi:cellulose synthase/poly-beta-1,6-N-acetylglucosamine synthase-like glycosyltransferase